MIRLRSSFLLGAMVVLVCALPAAAETIYVDIANQTGIEFGNELAPYSTIQRGIDNAQSGDLVLVAPGTYPEAVVMRDGVDVQGSGPDVTIIDGSAETSSVVSFDGLVPGPTFTGFTVTGGRGDFAGDVGGVPIKVGGGILVRNSSPTITRNVITGNVVEEGYSFGGGIYIYVTDSVPKVVDNVITGNRAVSLDLTDQGSGGAVYIKSKNAGATILENLLEGNDAVDGGAVWVEGSAATEVVIERNRIRQNTALRGGGVAATGTDTSVLLVRNNLFEDNGGSAAGAQGGGAWLEAQDQASFSAFNNTFADNAVTGGDGGGLWLDDRDSSALSRIGNNLIAGNDALQGGGIDHTLFDGEILTNNLFGNTGGDFHDGGGSGATLSGNLAADPLFVAPAAGNYRLGQGSGVIDSADEALAPSEDLDGFLRPYDGDGDLTGNSDIGAYEYPGGEVFGLTLDGDHVDWLPDAEAEAYHLYRGSLSVLRSTGAYIQDPGTEPLAAQFCDVMSGDLPFLDAYVPPAGEGVFYLVTLRIASWEGPLGIDSSGAIRPGGADCTP